ncbi:MAG: hypothetical protein J6T15_04760 [Bacilli bacterium]|nr:hypothetical protein [Bacilli bacterium]
MEIEINKMPRVINKNTYFNLGSNKSIDVENLEEVINLETQYAFEKYKENIKEEKLEVEKNKAMHEYILDKVKSLYKPLLDNDYMKQRDAISFVSGKAEEPFNDTLLENIVKDHPKDYKEIIKGVIDIIEGFDGTIDYSEIKKRVLKDSDIDLMSGLIVKSQVNSFIVKSYIDRLVCLLYDIVLATDTYEEYIEKKIVEKTPKVERSVERQFKQYKFSNIEEIEEESANNLINLFDYVLGSKLVNWVDTGRTIIYANNGYTTVNTDSGVIYKFRSGNEIISIPSEDIVKINREGKDFTVVL